MTDRYTTLLDTADRIVNVDLYPARLLTVIADLSAALREASTLLDESRAYGLALVEELRVRAKKTDQFVALATSMDIDFQSLQSAVEALGAMPEGFCFCSKNRIGDDSKIHEPECAYLRKALNGGRNAG